MEDGSPETIIEEREQLMVSPSSVVNPTLRIAYFLRPCMEDSKTENFLPPLSIFSETATSNPSESLVEVRYNGWRNPQEEWKTWVKKMKLKFESLWVKAGIDQSIEASTYEIPKNDDLILALAKRWCSKTNSFIFPWGEATVTLEDLKVCWGYSVLGDPVTLPLETNEKKEIEEELMEARRMFNKTKAKKVAHNPWMMHFMEYEGQVEHEAFLVHWLSRFVFASNARDSILKSVFPIAIHLAKGTRIALAPAVLASIYRDLSFLNSSMVDSSIVTLWAPFQLVQVWALERFPALQPYTIEIEQQGVARWNEVKMVKDKSLKLVLDSAGDRDGFLWRPYKNSPSLQVYNEQDMWICDNPNLDFELVSFAQCIRVSKLVGMGYVEQYLPHRVAMQFGMDQDIPAMVAECNKDPWMCYIQPILDSDLRYLIGVCQPNPSVTSRYYDWWKKSKASKEADTFKGYDCCRISVSSSEHLSRDPSEQVEGEECNVPAPSVGENDETAGSKSKDVLEDAQMEDVVGGARRAKDDETEAVIKSPFCGRNGVNNIGEEVTSPYMVGIASDLENRILKLERKIAKLKATKFGTQVKNVGGKAKT